MPRDLTVRVRADVGAYQKAMSSAVKSTDQLATAGLALQKKGLQISRLGDTLTKTVTLPLALAGAAAIKMAGDFDSSFVRMTTLAGVTGGEIDGLKEKVLDLAGETGRAPQELADALFFLSSSGLDSAQAMDALTVSAKASALGMGSTIQVADAVSSAMLAYADSGLSAAEATDVLVATARAGKAEPAELAEQMGRLLPIASELGITFGEVGGSIAALSQQGNNAERATTLLVNVMSKLLKPSQQAIKLLDEVGLSLDDVRASIEEKGLQQTLVDLRETLGDSGFVKFIEDTQAVQGALALTGSNAAQAGKIIADVKDSVGETDNAFSRWAESMGAQNAQAFAQFQVALIRVGEAIAPIAADVLSFVSKIVEGFNKLPEPVRNAIIVFAGLAAAVGPLLSVGGRLITTFGTVLRLLNQFVLPAGTISGAFNGTTVAAGRMSGALGVAGVAGALFAVSAGFAMVMRSKNQANFDEAAQEFAKIDEFSRKAAAGTGLLNDAVKVSTIDFTAGASAAKTYADSGKLTEQALRDLDKGFDSVLEKAPALAESFIKNAKAAGVPADTIGRWRDMLEEKIATDAAATQSQEAYNAAVEEATGVTKSATAAAQEHLDMMRAQFDPQFAMIDAMQQSATAQLELRDATAALTEARAAGDVDAITEAEGRYAAAVAGARTSVIDLHGAAVTLKASMEESGATAAQVESAFVDLAVQQGFTAAEANVMAEAFGIATGAADTLGATDPTVAVKETGTASTRTKLRATRDAAHSIPKSRNTSVSTTGTGSAVGALVGVRQAAGSIPRNVTIFVQAIQRGIANINPFAGRQHGGPVLAGETYMVGEAGPELLVMGGRRGHIIPNSGVSHGPGGGVMASGGGGGLVVNLDLRGAIVTNEDVFVRKVSQAVNKGTRLGLVNR